jgi:hypothetical protein
MTIYIDFYSGSHGHFLEYVINTWLFKGPRVSNIFTNLGASHLIRKDQKYMSKRLAIANHYSEFNKPIEDPSSVIRISVNNQWANYIYQINVMARAGDIPLAKKIKAIPVEVLNNTVLLRNQWYSKFNILECGYNLPQNWRWNNIPSFDFPMESLFDVKEFYQTLYKLGRFLQITFVPDIELSTLLKNFLDKNQGWQYYKQAENIVCNALNGNSVEFTSDEILQALINSLLTRTVGLFDGNLFAQRDYPTNTIEIWDAVNQHLKMFDRKF